VSANYLSVTLSTPWSCGFVVGVRFVNWQVVVDLLYNKLYNKSTTYRSNGAWALGRIAQMRSIATHVYAPWSVCLYGTVMSPAQAVELGYAVWENTLVGPRNQGVHIGAIWRIRLIVLCGNGDAACFYHFCCNLFSTVEIVEGLSV